VATKVFPVVHIISPEQAVEQVGVAFEHGADGAYLIDHRTSDWNVTCRAFNLAKACYPEFFLGVNILFEPTAFDVMTALLNAIKQERIDGLPDGVWVDDAMPKHDATRLLRVNNKALSGIRYLGGVAFKYTSLFTENPEIAAVRARELSEYVDVVTTSGSGTGTPPTPQKIEAMKKAIGDQCLAVASGVGVDNLHDYVDYIDELLVATSIETHKGSGVFDVPKLKELLLIAHKL